MRHIIYKGAFDGLINSCPTN